VSPATSAADMTFELLLDPERAARLVEQHALDPALPSLSDVLEQTSAAVFATPAGDGYQRAIARAVQRSMVDRLMDLAADAGMPQVRAEASQRLRALRDLARTRSGSADAGERAHAALLADDLGRFLDRRWEPRERRQPLSPPPGSPIGDEDPPR
jgi:hypothetical protein